MAYQSVSSEQAFQVQQQHPLTKEIYDEFFKSPLWTFEQTKQLLGLHQSRGRNWSVISFELQRGIRECEERCDIVQLFLQTIANGLGTSTTPLSSSSNNPSPPPSSPDSGKKRKRRAASDISREWKCDTPGCRRAYGSEGALKIHIKTKHPGIMRSCNGDGAGCDNSSTPVLQANAAGVRSAPTPPLTPLTVTSPVVSPSPSHTPCTPPDQLQPPSPEELVQMPIAMLNVKECNLPSIRIAVGDWIKGSSCCGDLMVRFSYDTRKFEWEVFHLRLLYKMEIPFDTITGIRYERVAQIPGDRSTAQLTVELSREPMYSGGTFRPHVSTAWRTTTKDFTQGEAQKNLRHSIFVLQISAKSPLEYLLQKEPRFAKIMKTNIDLRGCPKTSFPPLSVSASTPFPFSPPTWAYYQTEPQPIRQPPPSTSYIPPSPSVGVVPTQHQPHQITCNTLSDTYLHAHLPSTPSLSFMEEDIEPMGLEETLRRYISRTDCTCGSGCSASDCMCMDICSSSDSLCYSSSSSSSSSPASNFMDCDPLPTSPQHIFLLQELSY